jgi:diguanylate cyclase
LDDTANRKKEMLYDHSPEEAAEYLRMTLQFLGRHNLPGNPVNYTVWYEYAAKLNTQLMNAVDQSLSREQAITPEMTGTWFQEHVLYRGQGLVESVKTDLLKVLQEVFGDLSTAESDVSLFGKSMARFSERIGGVDDKEAFQETLKDLMLEVKHIENSSALFQKRLEHANDRVEKLQEKLKEVEQHATIDALTNLYNRRAFEGRLVQQMADASEKGGDLSLAIIDIDHFKRINDTYGHLTGDDLLRIIAKTLKDFLKGKDIVCRYGGEEFVVLLPETPLAGAVTVAEQIREHFSQMSWKQKSTGASLGKVTLSAGVALFRPGENMESFVQRADVALYHSKKTGRNRVTAEKQ